MEAVEVIHDANEVRAYAAKLNAELDRCDNGEGMECASLDASLEHYAARCCRLSEQIRLWGRDVFAGRVAFEESVEEAWIKAGVDLNNRAVEMLEPASQAEIPCYDLPGANKLGTALLTLYRLLDGWVSPRLSVGPAARQSSKLVDRAEEVRQKMKTLAPLPKEWMPSDARQQSVYRKTSKT